jgi:hypothetical protein
MIHAYSEKMQSQMMKAIAESSELLKSGACDSYDMYKFVVGKIAGLEEAWTLLQEGKKAFHEGKL